MNRSAPGYCSHDRLRQLERRSPGGNAPTTSVLLPADIRARLESRAAAKGVKPAEIMRRALVKYLDRHSA
ncbi:CopG family transcriptional regulator [Gordonia sp. (in: high G+C Gram-positive bacteria)]|uniref:ribbon-helix-helix domain-containing protein n=1 Tax=Gordonia sp. (in: high G+C Gram-positive bacteria) TaxID=84139 RepID=UPI001D80F63D|nr:CopG family transcriptional regulator [Gordonia sp. (in: high G+C Gram-positive bacteria)]MCB1296811.1 hypothetical protein [Gordonia sp. (in: high G+C Gram-positive bacteria)]HMS76380.1 CopG family transcriptional regulator [Gordonia sp. (in: high G+C Gram-positive bacteria)]HQV16701.1 CopG family transcriptional regulator [Gordonia sp. (in: high G+C Gram-positive bacteria)]